MDKAQAALQIRMPRTLAELESAEAEVETLEKFLGRR